MRIWRSLGWARGVDAGGGADSIETPLGLVKV